MTKWEHNKTNYKKVCKSSIKEAAKYFPGAKSIRRDYADYIGKVVHFIDDNGDTMGHLSVFNGHAFASVKVEEE